MSEMTVQDIVKHSTEVKESGEDWERVYVILHEAIKSNEYRILRAGNTLCMIKLLAPHEAQMFIFNADTNKNLLRNMKEFAKALDVAGFKKVFGETHDIQMINMIKRLGYPAKITDAGKDDQGRKLYRGTVNV
jgi:hypothetical protein